MGAVGKEDTASVDQSASARSGNETAPPHVSLQIPTA